MTELRRSELVASLGALRSRIAGACDAAGRETSSVVLIAVTKNHPAVDVRTLAKLGVLDVGESKDQEARAKIKEIEAKGHLDLRWHFLGRLQRKKARTVAGYAHAVHSLDRAVLIPLLEEGVENAERAPLEVFLQVSLDGDPERGGAAPEQLAELADAAAASPHLRLRGLMAVAPLDADADAAFARLAELGADVRAQHPEADALSAGMSHDLEAAIRHGATHLRVGTALLGRRTEVFG